MQEKRPSADDLDGDFYIEPEKTIVDSKELEKTQAPKKAKKEKKSFSVAPGLPQQKPVFSKDGVLMKPPRVDLNRCTPEEIYEFFSACFPNTCPPTLTHRTFRSNEEGLSLTDFIKTLKTPAAMKKADVPTVLVVASAALRVIDLIKEAKELGVFIGKMFAKHIEVEQQRVQLRTQKFAVLIGTPGRLCKLSEREAEGKKDGFIDLSKITTFVVDCQRDKTTRSIMEISETRNELFDLICRCLAANPKMAIAFF